MRWLDETQAIRAVFARNDLVALFFLEVVHELIPRSLQRIDPYREFRLLKTNFAYSVSFFSTQRLHVHFKHLLGHTRPRMLRDSRMLHQVKKVGGGNSFGPRLPANLQLCLFRGFPIADCIQIAFVALQHVHVFDEFGPRLLVEFIFAFEKPKAQENVNGNISRGITLVSLFILI